MKKILLIQPPMTLLKNEIKSLVFPLGLAYIAAVLEENKYDVNVLDCVALGHDKYFEKDGLIHFGLGWDDIYEKIKNANPDIVGVSCLFSSQSNNSHKVAELVKKIDRNIKVIFGGAHPSSVPEECMENDNIDFIVIGEGEVTVIKLIEDINNIENLKEIDGLAFRAENKVIINPKTKYLEDIDKLPLPARHLFPFDIYLNSKMGHGTDLLRPPLASMITSRGCPFNCVFCSVHTVWGKKFRPRNAKQVVDEIELLVKKYKVKEIHFEDDNLTLDKKRIIELCQGIIKRKLDIEWTVPNGVAIWTLDQEVLEYMKKSGCYKLCFGIESADLITQKFIRKEINLDQSRELIRQANKLRIWTHGFFIIGFPFETKEQINTTLGFACKSDLDFASFFLATPYPATDLYKIMKENKMIADLLWENVKTSTTSIKTKYFNSEKLVKLQKEMFIKFLLWQVIYSLNPARTWHRLRKIKSKEDLKFLLRYVKRFLQII